MTDSLRFSLIRDGNTVAAGVLFRDGAAVLRWLGQHPSFQTYETFQDVIDIHHVGKGTDLTWIDGVCFSCRTEANFWQGSDGNGGQCCRCGATWDGVPSFEAEPEKGAWRKLE